MDSTEELKQKYVQLQLMRQYLNTMVEEKSKVEEKSNEVMLTTIAMRKLKEQPKGQEMWSSFGSEVFVMSDIRNKEEVIAGVGAGVFVKKSVDEAIITLETRKAELEQINTSLAAEAIKLQAEILKLEPEVQELAEKLQKEEQSQQAG